MSKPFVLHLDRRPPPALLPLRNDAPLAIDGGGPRRAKVWDISPNLHCSIIGTCLSAAELRQFFVKFGDADARSASDHALHGRGVLAAGQHNLVGKLLHKALDARHESAIKRFAKAATTAELRELWRQAFEQGGIPGAYWAILTHPAADRPLIQDVFGEVHMLSHMVGSSSRLDMARLNQLARDLADRDDKIARQQARLSEGAAVRTELQRRIDGLEDELRRRAAADAVTADLAANATAAASLQQRLDAEKAHAASLAARVRELEEQLDGARRQVVALQDQAGHLQGEVTALEAALAGDEAPAPDQAAAAPDLSGLTLLYVGGRPSLIEQLKSITAKHGGKLLSHDGGIEDNAGVLPGLLSRADIALFPVDCISHAAAGQIKKLCRDACKPFVPLRTASVASFIAATRAPRPGQTLRPR